MKPLALVVGAVASLASWYFVDDADPFELLLFTVYLFSPYGFLAFKPTRLGNVARGAALLVLTVMTVGMYLSVATSESSTAAIGLVMLPLYQWVVIGIVSISVVLKSRGRGPAGENR